MVCPTIQEVGFWRSVERTVKRGSYESQAISKKDV
jgi:hypothetical protein